MHDYMHPVIGGREEIAVKDALILLGSVVHQLQKERACCCLYIGSQGNQFCEQVNNQFELSDRVVARLAESMSGWSKYGSISDTSIKRLEETLNTIRTTYEKRSKVLDLSWAAPDIIRTYSHQLIYPLLGISIETALFDKNNATTRVSAYANFIRWKEHAGRERAIGIHGFLTHGFTNPQYVDWLQFQISEQTSLQETFFNLAGETQKHCLDEFIKGSAQSEIQKIHHALEEDPNAPVLHNMTAESWYSLMTEKIDLMHAAEHRLIDTLKLEPTLDDKNASEVNPSARHDVDDNFLAKLPLFNGVPNEIVDLFNQSKLIRHYAKGTTLFHENQVPSQLFIILNGWVKLYKGTAQGDETTLQMLSSGDILGEAQVLLREPFNESAEVVEDTLVILLPAVLFYQQVLKSHVFAFNLLRDMSRLSQNILQQIKSTRLQSTHQRIGWFLLKLLLDQGGIDKQQFQLPYSKSIIASFLDMRPETFSRTLKQFRTDGFEFEKNTVKLPSVDALCSYCDLHLASACNLRGTPNCYQPVCASRDYSAP